MYLSFNKLRSFTAFMPQQNFQLLEVIYEDFKSVKVLRKQFKHDIFLITSQTSWLLATQK